MNGIREMVRLEGGLGNLSDPTLINVLTLWAPSFLDNLSVF